MSRNYFDKEEPNFYKQLVGPVGIEPTTEGL
jgi:hypothetical protein